ncbi:hypothetical protein F4802DRAFT_498557 [Xylaria palmicola]|nr:hypothetical protein F4802DRAFT_498557 [Xylaria palmicola]
MRVHRPGRATCWPYPWSLGQPFEPRRRWCAAYGKPHRSPTRSPAPACFTTAHVGVAYGVLRSIHQLRGEHTSTYPRLPDHEARWTSIILQYARHAHRSVPPPPRYIGRHCLLQSSVCRFTNANGTSCSSFKMLACASSRIPDAMAGYPALSCHWSERKIVSGYIVVGYFESAGRGPSQIITILELHA